MSNICVIGAGYVGLVTAVGFAELGHRVKLVEIDGAKLDALEQNVIPIHEPGLEDLWIRAQENGRIEVTNNYIHGLLGADFVFITVGTPSTKSGKPSLKWVRIAARSIAETASGPVVVVMKSTVPVGTADIITRIIGKYRRDPGLFPVVSNPEFLREGSAVDDFFRPNRVVVGASDPTAAEAVARLYRPLGQPIVMCNNTTAELSKYASNAFLATKISFINEIALLCEECGVDVTKVSQILGMDPRIGSSYLNAGLGWGGSCLPKDVKGLIFMGEQNKVHMHLTQMVSRINQSQPNVVINKLKRLLSGVEGKTIGILGLSFKPGSDDLRETRSLLIIEQLSELGCNIKACDPVAAEKASQMVPDLVCYLDVYDLARDCDALVLVTEWEEFRDIDLYKLASVMRNPVFIDGRNLFEPEQMKRAGFIYEGIGRRQPNRETAELAEPGYLRSLP